MWPWSKFKELNAEIAIIRKENTELKKFNEALQFEFQTLRVTLTAEILKYATKNSSLDTSNPVRIETIPTVIPVRVKDINLPLREIMFFEKTKDGNEFLYQVVAQDIITGKIVRYALSSAIDCAGDAVMSSVIAGKLIDGLKTTLMDAAVVEFLKKAKLKTTL